MLSVDSTFIKDLATSQLPYSTTIFYLWVVSRFCDREFTVDEASGFCHKRNTYRHLHRLQAAEMIAKRTCPQTRKRKYRVN